MIGTKIKFDAAHRQLGDEGKCGKLHGHSWRVEIIIDGPIDDIGYIIDFKEIKNIIDLLDHATILNSLDDLGCTLKNYKQKVYTLDYKNPTCENLADHIFDILICTYPYLTYCNVKIWETDDSWAQTTKKIF